MAKFQCKNGMFLDGQFEQEIVETPCQAASTYTSLTAYKCVPSMQPKTVEPYSKADITLPLQLSCVQSYQRSRFCHQDQSGRAT